MRQPSLLRAIFWNQILWLIPLLVAMTSPILLLAFLGVFWFCGKGHVLLLLGLSFAGFFLIWGLILTLRHFRLPKRATAARERKARQEVEGFIRDFNYEAQPLGDWRGILKAIRELNARVARQYGIRSRNPELDLPLSYVLLAVQQISADMERYLSQNAQFLGFKPLEWIQLRHLLRFLPGQKESHPRAQKTPKKESSAARGSRAAGKASSDSGAETRSEEESRGLFAIPQWVSKKILSHLFRLVGHYSVLLYCGQLRYRVEAQDAWKFPLKVSLLEAQPAGTDGLPADLPPDSEENPLKAANESGPLTPTPDMPQPLAELLQAWKGTPGVESAILEERQNAKISRLTVSGWGEIQLTELLAAEPAGGIRRKFQSVLSSAVAFVSGNSRAQAFSGHEVIPEDLLKSDLLVIYVSGKFIQTAPEELETSLLESLKRRLASWLNLPSNRRPLLVLALESERFEEAVRTRICSALELAETDVSFWLLKSGTPSAALICVGESENVPEPEGLKAAEVPAEADSETQIPENSLLADFLRFCEPLSEKLLARKVTPQSPAIRLLARQERQNGFFRSRFVTWQWMAALYAVVLFACFALGGVLYSQEKSLQWLKRTEACETEPISSASDSAANSGMKSVLLPTTSEQKGLGVLPPAKFSPLWWRNVFRKHSISILATLSGLGLVFFWLKFHVRIPPLKVEPASDWPKREMEAFEKLKFTINSFKLSDLEGLKPIYGSLGTVLECVDRHYSQKKEIRNAITLAETLKAQQILIAKIQQTLALELPGMDYLRLRDLRFGLKIYQIYVRIFDLYRKVLWFDPVSASVLEFRRTIHQSILKSFSHQLQASSVIYGLELVGYYALELYSGHLFYQRESEPVSVFLIQSSAEGAPELRETLLRIQGPSQRPLCWKVSDDGLELPQSWFSSLFRKKSPFQRLKSEMLSADVVLLLSDSADAPEIHHEQKKLISEFLGQISKIERAPVFAQILKVSSPENSFAESDSEKWPVFRWNPSEWADESREKQAGAFQTQLETFLQSQAETIQLRQTFRVLREYAKNHPR